MAEPDMSDTSRVWGTEWQADRRVSGSGPSTRPLEYHGRAGGRQARQTEDVFASLRRNEERRRAEEALVKEVTRAHRTMVLVALLQAIILALQVAGFLGVFS